MGINVEQLKSKLSVLKSKNSSKKNIWRPKKGSSKIRIVPYTYDKGNPFRELYFHYGINGKPSMLSPKTYNEADPFIELSEAMLSEGNLDKEEYKTAKGLEPKLRTFVPVVVEGEEDQGVRFWGFGIKIYQKLLEIVSDADFGDITDPYEGNWVKVTSRTPEECGNKYGETTIDVLPKPSAVTSDTELMRKILEEQSKVEDLYPRYTYDELKFQLDKHVNPDPEKSNTEETTETQQHSENQTTEQNLDKQAVLNKFENVLNNSK